MGRYLLVAVMLVVLPGANGWGQGSKPALKEQGGGMQLSLETSATLLQAGPIVATAHEDSHKGKKWIRTHRRANSADSRWAMRVEFVDEGGKVAGDLVQGMKVEGREISVILPAQSGSGVVSVEYTEYKEGERNGPENPGWIIRYLSVNGIEQWRTYLCCDSGGSLENRVILSEDGSIVALLDAGEGQLCYAGERGYPAPPGCAGLRVFTAEGKEILREPKGGGVEISPKGRFVVFSDGTRWKTLDIRTSKVSEINIPKGYGPHEIEDSGTIYLYWRNAPNPPGRDKYRVVPGKGMEKVKD